MIVFCSRLPTQYSLVGFLVSALSLSGCQGTSRDNTGPATARERTARTRVERGPVTVTVEVSPEPCRLSDEPQLTLTIEHEPGIKIQPPPFGESLGDFVIRDFHEPLPQTVGGRNVWRQVYQLEPTEAGPLQIDPILVTFSDDRPGGDGREHRVETEAITVNVFSPLDQTSPSLAQLKGPQGPVPLPAPAWSSWWWFSGAAVLLLAGGAIWWARYRRCQPSLPAPTPRELAARELAALWDSETARGEVKLYYVELTGIVRRYIERTTGIRAPEQTTEEFLREVGGSTAFSGDEQQRLQGFLQSADLVKFAAYQPEYGDIEESYRRARRFVGLTEDQEQPA